MFVQHFLDTYYFIENNFFLLLPYLIKQYKNLSKCIDNIY